MSRKQDSNGVRTPQDLENKFDFSSLLGLKKNVEFAKKNILHINNELNNILKALIINLKDVLNNQSEVSLWFYAEKPTIRNEPYINWKVPTDHIGDLYYDKSTGYVYQYYENGWIRNNDNSLIQAMALTNTEIPEKEHERKVFFEEPKTPYSSGDWWIKDDGILYICQLGKTKDLIFEDNDFVPSNQYSTTVAIKQNDKITVLEGTVTQISKDFVKFTDLATGGSTTIAGENIKTGVITSSNYKSNVSGTLLDLNKGIIDTKNFKVDEFGNVHLADGSEIINGKGLMTNLQYLGQLYNEFGLMPFGIQTDEMNNQFSKSQIIIYANIPDNFTIERAFITIIHQPALWNQINWGYARNIGIYKSKIEGKFEGDWQSDFMNPSVELETQLTGIFTNDENSWQPEKPSLSNSKIEIKKTLNIANKLNKGLNKIVIQTTDKLPVFDMDFNKDIKLAMENSGRAMAILDIYGFMKKEEEEK